MAMLPYVHVLSAQHVVLISVFVGIWTVCSASWEENAKASNQDVLNEHNVVRCAHDVPPLEWDDKLAGWIQQCVDTMTSANFHHCPYTGKWLYAPQAYEHCTKTYKSECGEFVTGGVSPKDFIYVYVGGKETAFGTLTFDKAMEAHYLGIDTMSPTTKMVACAWQHGGSPAYPAMVCQYAAGWGDARTGPHLHATRTEAECRKLVAECKRTSWTECSHGASSNTIIIVIIVCLVVCCCCCTAVAIHRARKKSSMWKKARGQQPSIHGELAAKVKETAEATMKEAREAAAHPKEAVIEVCDGLGAVATEVKEEAKEALEHPMEASKQLHGQINTAVDECIQDAKFATEHAKEDVNEAAETAKHPGAELTNFVQKASNASHTVADKANIVSCDLATHVPIFDPTPRGPRKGPFCACCAAE